MDFLDRMRTRAQARARGSYLGERTGKSLCFSQHDMNAANGSGATVRADYNNALVALATLSSGATAPSTTFAYQLWADTTSSTLKRRNAANTGWLVVRSLDESFVLSRSSNTILGLSDIAKTIRATSTFTQTLTAAATLGDGWFIHYINEGSGVITFDPNGAETIAGQTTLAFQPGESGTIVCNGSNFQIVSRSRYAGAIGVGRNIASRTDATTPNSKINITADELQLSDGAGGFFVAKSVSVTGDMAASGANGLDTGAEASGTWYYGWVIAKPDGTVAALISASSSAPTMPSGYTFKALITAMRNDGSSNFIKYRQFGNRVFYEATNSVLSGGSATTETAISTSGFVPPNAQSAMATLRCNYNDTSANTNRTCSWRVVSGSDFTSVVVASPAAGSVNAWNGTDVEIPNISQNLYYLWDAATGGRGANCNIKGFTLPMAGQ